MQDSYIHSASNLYLSRQLLDLVQLSSGAVFHLDPATRRQCEVRTVVSDQHTTVRVVWGKHRILC